MAAFLASINYNTWILPALLIIPTIGSLIVWLHGAVAGQGEAASMTARRLTLWILILEFIVSIGLWWSLDQQNAQWQAVFDKPWIEAWGTRFTVGVDGLSVMMVLLTTLLMPLAILGGWTSVRKKVHGYHSLMLILTTGMLGVFVAKDLFLFYVMWEVMLVPMYFIIGIWGGERRIYASLKFFVYTMAASLLMLVAIIYLGLHARDATGTPNFSYDNLLTMSSITPKAAMLRFGAFAF